MTTITDYHNFTINDFTEKYRKSKTKRESERWIALKMVAMEQDISFIADILGHDKRTIKEWIKRFNENGVEGIMYEPPEGQKKNYR